MQNKRDTKRKRSRSKIRELEGLREKEEGKKINTNIQDFRNNFRVQERESSIREIHLWVFI